MTEAQDTIREVVDWFVLVIEAGELYTEATFPTKERDAYERLYLDSGFTATADAHIAILAGGTVGGGTTVNWMTSIPIPETKRSAWVWPEAPSLAGGNSAAKTVTDVKQKLNVTKRRITFSMFYNRSKSA